MAGTVKHDMVFVAADLVAYAEGSIVSAQLTKNDAGNITLFAFDAEQGLSEHAAPFDAVVQVLDGEGTFTVGGTPHVVRQGETIIMPANIPHAVHANTPMKMMLTMIKGTTGFAVSLNK
ncbi:MAG: cupin domain-containing protein [Alloprevotella sp.]|nr:cupin domain-containing protein [Alloprevotella sp.]